MVYQHFTVVPAMTVAENLLLARPDLPQFIRWSAERKRLTDFLATAPFQVDLNAKISDLAAGQKQKVEILKQLYLQSKILILDEPTSVLTPGEADEVLGMLRRTGRSEATERSDHHSQVPGGHRVLRRSHRAPKRESDRPGQGQGSDNFGSGHHDDRRTPLRERRSKKESRNSGCRFSRSKASKQSGITAYEQSMDSNCRFAPGKSSALPGSRATANANWSRSWADSGPPRPVKSKSGVPVFE